MGNERAGEVPGTRRVEGIDSSASGKARPRGGLRVLIPGYSQWWWGQRERGLILFGWFTAALATSSFLWGTFTGFALLLFAYFTHAASTSDALAQEAFPPRNGIARGLGVSLGLAFGVYLPLLFWLTLVAWPSLSEGSNADGYLVNCRAFHQSEPQRDDWVCFRSTPRGDARVGRVVAVDGQEVDWSIDTLRVNGRRVDDLHTPFRGSGIPRQMSYRMPAGHVLVNIRDRPVDGNRGEGLVIVARDQIVGRAWARIYPIRERQLRLSGPRATRSQES